MARKERPHPVTYAVAWPDHVIVESVPAEAARQFAENLRAAIKGRSTYVIGKKCGLDPTTIQKILNGKVWPDAMTIAMLQHGLDADLWPTPADVRDAIAKALEGIGDGGAAVVAR